MVIWAMWAQWALPVVAAASDASACSRRARRPHRASAGSLHQTRPGGGAGGRWQLASAQPPPGHGSSLSARRACSVKSTRLRDPGRSGPPSHGPWPWVSNAPFHVTGPGVPPKATGDCPAHPRFLARTRTLAVTRTLMSQHLTTVPLCTPRHGSHGTTGFCAHIHHDLTQATRHWHTERLS